MDARFDLASTDVLHRVASEQAAWLHRHVRTVLAGLAVTVLLADLLDAAGHDGGFVAAHPGSLSLDAAFIGLLLVLVAGAAAQAVFAARARRLAAGGAAPAPCTVHRLAAATRMRRDYLLVRRAGAPAVLVRCGRDAGLAQLPERCDGVLVAGGRFGPVIIGTPDLPPIVGNAGRYERLLPRSLRGDWVRSAVGGRRPSGAD